MKKINERPFAVQQVVAPFVDGRLVESDAETVFERIDPSTGKHSVTIPTGCGRDVDRAVVSARRSFEDGRWSDVPPSIRKATLHRFADRIEDEAAMLDALDAGEMGKPISEVRANAAAAAGLMRFFAETLDKVLGDVHVTDKSTFVVQRNVPRGVVAAIVAWNFPTYNFILKAAPALAAGNCVVAKPSELASRSAMRLAQLAVEVGIPPGVLNVVPGLGEPVGRSLGLHMEVDMVTFTGSTAVGKQIMQYAGQSNLKVVMAECGGKSPHVVFGDGVDLDAAGNAIASLLLVNQGQLCSAGSRLIVERSVEPELVEIVASRMKRILMGDALDYRTTFGPMVSELHCQRVMQYIDAGRAEGAELVIGGRRALEHTGGYFLEPTVFREVLPTARVAQEEIFGPVLSIIPVADEEEAIRVANGTAYGLAAYLWTASLSRGMRMAKSIRSPVWINAANPIGEGAGHGWTCEPTGLSGIGVEGGLAGFEKYLRRQLVWINHS